MKTRQNNRRNFLKHSLFSAGLLSAMNPLDLFGHSFQSKPTQQRHLKLAGYDFPRLKAIFDKSLSVEGFSYEIEKDAIGNLNSSAFSGAQPYDVTEIGIIPYILAYANDGFRDYSLIPVFPLRLFRHKSIYVRSDGGIEKPEDLKGKKVGVPGYSSSSLTWIRGMLKDQYGLLPSDITWVISNKDSSADVAGKISAQEQVRPEGVDFVMGTPGKDESELLMDGEVDALFHAAQPKAFLKGDPKIRRLFQDSRKTEQNYFRQTGIFPIMHAVAIRNSLFDEQPELIAEVFDLYTRAKQANFDYMKKLAWAYDSLPWYGQEFESTMAVMGKNYWSYGWTENEVTLEKICQYAYDQGLAKKQVEAKDLFHPKAFALSENRKA